MVQCSLSFYHSKVVLHKKLKFSMLKNHQFCSIFRIVVGWIFLQNLKHASASFQADILSHLRPNENAIPSLKSELFLQKSRRRNLPWPQAMMQAFYTRRSFNLPPQLKLLRLFASSLGGWGRFISLCDPIEACPIL